MDVYSSTQIVRIAPLSHLDDGLLTPMFARPTTESRLLETLARDLAALLAGNTQHDVLCVAEHSPVWSGAACGDGRGLVTRWSANDRFVRLLYGCHIKLARMKNGPPP